MSVDLTFRRYDSDRARANHDIVSLIHQDAYAEAIATGDPFESVEAFMTRFDSYTSRPGNGFELVVGYLGSEPVGQTWGWPLGPKSLWWSDLEEEPEPGFTDEDGTRTFALSEIMVRKEWTGQGLAHQLHDELLTQRREQRATLLVEQDNDTAYKAYEHWGWQRVTQFRPGWPDAPLMHVMILSLPLSQ
ncbi:MAG: Acetyltransferase family [Acidimicrobiales bacterium]|nr:Acetyltransferase family [Acidimicrobiales bacterium]